MSEIKRMAEQPTYWPVVLHVYQRAGNAFRELYEMQLWFGLIEMWRECNPRTTKYCSIIAADAFIHKAVYMMDTERLRTRYTNWCSKQNMQFSTAHFLFDWFLLAEQTRNFYLHYLKMRSHTYRPPHMKDVLVNALPDKLPDEENSELLKDIPDVIACLDIVYLIDQHMFSSK